MAEFDSYAAGYDGGMQHRLKRLLGRSAEDYVAVKARCLLKDLARRPQAPSTLPRTRGRAAPRILDVGCHRVRPGFRFGFRFTASREWKRTGGKNRKSSLPPNPRFFLTRAGRVRSPRYSALCRGGSCA